MKHFVLILCIIPILSFTQDKKKIANFINDVYGSNYYFLDTKPRSVLYDELDEDFEGILSKEERESYKVALRPQIINFNWQDFPLKKAIFCENGRPIVSEKNIPIECITFVSKKLSKYKRNEIYNTSIFTIFYNGKDLSEKKKNKLYAQFLKKMDRSNKIYVKSLSQPIFFGANYVLITASSEIDIRTRVFKLESNTLKELGR